MTNTAFKEKSLVPEFAYVNKAGDAKHYFPEKLGENNGIVLVKDNYSIEYAPSVETDTESKKENIFSTEIKSTELIGNTITNEYSVEKVESEIDKLVYTCGQGMPTYRI